MPKSSRKKITEQNIREQYHKETGEYHSYNCSEKGDNVFYEELNFTRNYILWLENEFKNHINDTENEKIDNN